MPYSPSSTGFPADTNGARARPGTLAPAAREGFSMQVREPAIADAFEFAPDIHADERGVFGAPYQLDL